MALVRCKIICFDWSTAKDTVCKSQRKRVDHCVSPVKSLASGGGGGGGRGAAPVGSCALVSNSGALKKSGLGAEVDAHDVVFRFNNAPTKGHESDVGEARGTHSADIF